MAINRDPLEALVERWEPRLRQAFLDAVADLAGRVDVSTIATMLERGDVEVAIRAVGLDKNAFTALSNAIAEAYADGGSTVIATVPAARDAGGALIKILFDVRNPRAEAWIKSKSSGLVQQIVDDQRETIRTHLTEGLIAGKNPRTTALELVGRKNPTTGKREGGVIGLTSSQEAWQRAYAAELASADPADLRKALARGLRDKRFDRSIAKALKDGTGLPADIQAKMRLAYRARSLKFRADTISRTETIRALGAAQAESYQQAIDGGQVEADQILRFWVTAGDERVRTTHQMIPGMNEKGRRWSEPFSTPTGPSMHAPHDVDPMCRCREMVRLNYFKGLR